jgi:hypothetical protein
MLELTKQFRPATSHTYPPFKNGLYLEEYFLNKIKNEEPLLKRKYIPALWTNFQIEHWFPYLSMNFICSMRSVVASKTANLPFEGRLRVSHSD